MPRTARRAGQASVAVWLTAAVLLLQAALIYTFIMDPSDPPRSGSLWQALWALMHKPSFYPLVALLVVGPPATWIGWTVPGRHRLWLAASWGVFLPLLITIYGHRVSVMLKILWVHGAG